MFNTSAKAVILPASTLAAVVGASEKRRRLLFLQAFSSYKVAPGPLIASNTLGYAVGNLGNPVVFDRLLHGDIVGRPWTGFSVAVQSTIIVMEIFDEDSRMEKVKSRNSGVNLLVFTAAGNKSIGASNDRIGIIFFPCNAVYTVANSPTIPTASVGFQISSGGIAYPLMQEEVGDVVKQAWNVFSASVQSILIVEIFPSDEGD